MKAISKMGDDLKNEYNLKNENDLKNKDNLKDEDNLKNEDDVKDEDDLKIVKDHTALPYTADAVIFLLGSLSDMNRQLRSSHLIF